MDMFFSQISLISFNASIFSCADNCMHKSIKLKIVTIDLIFLYC